MAAAIPASPVLDPQLAEDWDDEDDTYWKRPLEALLNGTQTPLQSAQQLDDMIRTKTTAQLQALLDYADSHVMTAEERESGDWGELPAPQPSAIAEDFFQAYCRVCTAFSPYSEGQNRLIEFVQQLKALPRWMAPEGRPDGNGKVSETEFWAFGFGWIGLTEVFRKLLGTDIKPEYYRDTAAHNRWRNLQHTMARLTALRLVYCAPFNSLQDLAPFGSPSKKPNLEYDLVAAAQWVLRVTECRYVYLECLKQNTTDFYWQPWSKERWLQWKTLFQQTDGCGLYDEATRIVARRALKQMLDVEEEVTDCGSEGSPVI